MQPGGRSLSAGQPGKRFELSGEGACLPQPNGIVAQGMAMYFGNILSKNNKIYLLFKIFFVCLPCRKYYEPLKTAPMEIEKVIRIVALFICMAAFAVHVASRLLMPETSSDFNVPILFLMLLAVTNLWRETARPKQTE